MVFHLFALNWPKKRVTLIFFFLYSWSFRSLCNTVNAYGLACSNCTENCTYILFSNKITFLMDLLMHQLTVCKHFNLDFLCVCFTNILKYLECKSSRGCMRIKPEIKTIRFFCCMYLVSCMCYTSIQTDIFASPNKFYRSIHTRNSSEWTVFQL